jgi:LPS-assembly lipoprotein
MKVFLFTFGLLFALAACGFTPVYKQGNERAALAAITVDTPNTREGQQLKAALEDTLAPQGQAASPRYRLSPNFTISLEPLSIESDGTTRRYRMIGTADMVLTDLATGKPAYTSRVQRFNSYHISEGDYSTYVASQDANRQLIHAMAEALRLRLIGFLATQEGSPTVEGNGV